VNKSPSATVSGSQKYPPLPPPTLARYLADGDELLDDEGLCTCEHLEGDHRIGRGRCSRCRCPEFAPVAELETTVRQEIPSDAEVFEDLGEGAAR
jgi:hypothetical protein